MKPLNAGIAALCAAIFVFAASCSQEPPAPEPVRKPAKAAEQAKTAEQTLEEQKSAGAPEKTLRNPFLSHIVLRKGSDTAKKVRGPLECCELNAFKLVAVVASTEKASALVQAPDSKRYIVRVGTIIGDRDGKVVRIGKRSIVVKENVYDISGNAVSSTDTELKLPADRELQFQR